MTAAHRESYRSCNETGFTLIELMVASALTIALLGLVIGTLTNLSRLSVRSTTLLTMHDSVAGVYRTLSERLSSVHPGCAWYCEADPGADGVWGTDDESVSISWMASIPFRNEENYGFAGGDQYDLTWFRLQWRGEQHIQGPGLFLGRARGKQGNTSPWSDPVYTGKVYYYFNVWPQPRRDRRRDLDDNDLRTIEGISPVIYTWFNTQIIGDGKELTEQSRAILHDSFTITDFSLAWVARNGDRVNFTPDAGLVRHAASGSVLPTLGTPWNSGTQIVEDGLFLDARSHTLAPDTRDIAAARPALLRLAFTLRMRQVAGPVPRAREAVTQKFHLSIPLGPTLPAP